MSYEVGKWYGWTGGDCPVHPHTKVICKFDDGAENCEPEAAGTWIWWGCDIVAFKVVEEYKEPREFWVLLSHLKGVSSQLHDTKVEAKNHMTPTDELIKVREVKE